MILDLRPLLRGEVDHMDIDYALTPDPIEDITFDSDAHVTGRITDNARYMRLTLRAEVGYKGECARCLDPVSGNFTVDFERTVCEEGSLTDENVRLDDEDVYSDGYAIVRDGKLDVDEELREELLLNFPSRLLCSEDCPGLCPKCGKPRRLGDCGCPEKEIDPRLAVLKTLLHKDDADENEPDKK